MLLCIFFKWLCYMLFGQYGVKFFHNILGILIFLWYYEKNWTLYCPKSIWQSHLKNMHSSINVVHFLVCLYIGKLLIVYKAYTCQTYECNRQHIIMASYNDSNNSNMFTIIFLLSNIYSFSFVYICFQKSPINWGQKYNKWRRYTRFYTGRGQNNPASPLLGLTSNFLMKVGSKVKPELKEKYQQHIVSFTHCFHFTHVSPQYRPRWLITIFPNHQFRPEFAGPYLTAS